MTMAEKYLAFELEAVTQSPIVSGEIKADRRGEIKLARITGNGRVAVPIYGALKGYLELMPSENGERVCDTGARDAKP